MPSTHFKSRSSIVGANSRKSPFTGDFSLIFFFFGLRHVSISIHWKFPNLLFSPVTSCLFDSPARQLPVDARIPCFLVSEQSSLKFSPESLFLLPPPTQKLTPPPLFMFLSAYFSWTLMFFFLPLSVIMHFKVILLSNSVAPYHWDFLISSVRFEGAVITARLFVSFISAA